MSDAVAPVFSEVAPRIHRIDIPLGERYVSLYLVVGDDRALLFDVGTTGMIGAAVLPALVAVGVRAADVCDVVISHCDVDHFGGLADAREAFVNARIVAHERDAAAIQDFATYIKERGDSFREFGWEESPETLDWARSVTSEDRLDGVVHGGEQIDLGGVVVTLLHVPGHSRGHLALFVPSAGALIVSDAVLGTSVDLANGTPAFPPTYRFVDDYLESIDIMGRLNAETLLTAHYPTMSGEHAAEFLQQSHAFVEATEGLIERLVREAGEVTFRELIERANPLAGEWPAEGTQGALAFPIAGHLERLESNGTLVSRGVGDGRVWRAR